MTTFKAALDICGLSQTEAASFLRVSLGSIKKMCAGIQTVPPGIWSELASLYQRIEDAADFAASNLEPGLIDQRALSNVQADDGADPLPGHGADVAGAMALLLSIADTDE